jgi:CHASE3 domain sensor protein
MDVQQLVGEVAKRHNVLVDPSEPIFVSVTLNELLLAEHLRKVQAALEQAERTAALASSRHVESARWAAAQLMTDGAKHVSDQVRSVGSALRIQLEQLVRDSITAVQASAAEAERHHRRTRWAAIAAMTSACVALGAAAALWLRST